MAHRAGIARRFLKSSNGTWPSCIRPTRPGGRPRDKLTADIKNFAMQGKVGASAATLAAALRSAGRLQQGAEPAVHYANLLADEDTRVSSHEAMRAGDGAARRRAGAESSFIEPELLEGRRGVGQGVRGVRGRSSKVYSFYLSDVFRRARHTLSDAEEKLLADAGPLAGNPSSLYNILSNADFPFPDGDAQRRQERQAGSGGVQRAARVAQSRRSRRRSCPRSSARSARSAARSARR